jgi:hypothetical protein
LQAERTGIPPGWFVLDEEWTTIIDATERRAVALIDLEGVDRNPWACYQRWGNYGLEYYLIGWVMGEEDAEAWLRGEVPSVFAVLGVLPGHVTGIVDSPQYAQGQR